MGVARAPLKIQRAPKVVWRISQFSGAGATVESSGSNPLIVSIILLALIVAAVGLGGLMLALLVVTPHFSRSPPPLGANCP